jgi:hypothetical protein
MYGGATEHILKDTDRECIRDIRSKTISGDSSKKNTSGGIIVCCTQFKDTFECHEVVICGACWYIAIGSSFPGYSPRGESFTGEMDP